MDEKKAAQKRGALGLVKEFFGLSMEEAKTAHKEISGSAMIELASAIAVEKGIPTEELGFTVVKY